MLITSTDKYPYHRALRLDSRVGVLNILMIQKYDPGKSIYTKPHLAARVFRKILTPVKLVKAFFRKLRGQPPHLPFRDSNPIDLKMAVNGLHASQMPWMAMFRKSLNHTFGFKVADSMMTEIDDLEMWVT